MIVVGFLLVLFGVVRFYQGRKVLRENVLNLAPREQPQRMAALVAARDESRVIAGLLKSIAKQTVELPMKDVYVIVETLEDPTVQICKDYGASVILREHVKRQRKGYALDEAVKQILAAGRHYNMYFVFDADNVLAENYVERMLASYEVGYQMATGYRNSKNANDNVISAVSSLTFSMINVLGNRWRAHHHANIIFSGTGCYVDGELVEKWKGWPFHSLTEDYEMSLYAVLHGLSTDYNEEAMFYDEQPTKFSQTVAQRTRWIKGYFSARKRYIPLMRKVKRSTNIGSIKREIIGVRPVICMLIGVILILVGGTAELVVTGSNAWLALTVVIGVIVTVYLVLMVVTVEMVKREKLKLRKDMKYKAILFNPIYLVTYIWCALKALFTRNVEWTKIEHSK